MFLLLLMGLGAASVKAQVRIGGNTPPNPAAALDLNAAEGTIGTKGLALPRVTLGSSTATLDGTTANITGMLVYNTSGSLSTGVYYWSGTNWNRVDGATLGGDTIVGNEVTGATPGRGLVTAGTGTSSNPYTIGIAPGGITPSMLAPANFNLSTPMYVNGSWIFVVMGWADTIVSIPATTLTTLKYPSRCVAITGVNAFSTVNTWVNIYNEIETGDYLVQAGATTSVRFRFWCWLAV